MIKDLPLASKLSDKLFELSQNGRRGLFDVNDNEDDYEDSFGMASWRIIQVKNDSLLLECDAMMLGPFGKQIELKVGPDIIKLSKEGFLINMGVHKYENSDEWKITPGTIGCVYCD